MSSLKKVSIIDEDELKKLPFKIIDAIIKTSIGNFKFVSIKDGIELNQLLIKKYLVIALGDILSVEEIPIKFLLEEIKKDKELDDKELDDKIQKFFKLIEEMSQEWKIIKKEMMKKGLIKLLPRDEKKK